MYDHNRPQGYVYVLTFEDGHIKIGVTIDPDARTSSIVAASGRTVVSTWTSPVIENFRQVEKAAHREFANYRTNGEFFNMGAQEAIAFISELCEGPKLSDLAPFAFEGRQVRVVMRHGEPWFVAVDVCRVLELENTTKALLRIDDDDKSQVIDVNTLISNAGNQVNDLINIVSEAGLYSLIMGSRKPEAKQFKRWVTREVLPSIRKTGRYSVESADDLRGEWSHPLKIETAARLWKISERLGLLYCRDHGIDVSIFLRPAGQIQTAAEYVAHIMPNLKTAATYQDSQVYYFSREAFGALCQPHAIETVAGALRGAGLLLHQQNRLTYKVPPAIDQTRPNMFAIRKKALKEFVSQDQPGRLN